MLDQRGSAAVESIFTLVFVTILVLATLQIGFLVYGRNVVASSAHEAARALIELGTDPGTAEVVAEETVYKAAGGLATNFSVDAYLQATPDRDVASVAVSASVRAVGPIPVSIPVSVTATASRLKTP